MKKTLTKQLNEIEGQIIEKSAENNTSHKPNNYKQGKLQMDCLPINWCKYKHVTNLLEILNQCLGIQQFNNKLDKIDTVATFKKIYLITANLYKEFKLHEAYYGLHKKDFSSNSMSKFNTQDIIESQMPILKNLPEYKSVKFQKRIKSSVINNSCILNYLNISDQTPSDKR